MKTYFVEMDQLKDSSQGHSCVSVVIANSMTRNSEDLLEFAEMVCDNLYEGAFPDEVVEKMMRVISVAKSFEWSARYKNKLHTRAARKAFLTEYMNNKTKVV